MQFTAESEGNSVVLDAKTPIGSGSGLTPKELVAIAVASALVRDGFNAVRRVRG